MRASLRVKPSLDWLLGCCLVLLFMASAYVSAIIQERILPTKKAWAIYSYPR